MTNLPHEHHVLRYASWTKLRKDEDDNVLGLLPQALELRKDEKGVSLTWIEWFEGAIGQRYILAVNAIRGSITVTARGGIAKANVGRLHELCKTFATTIRVIHKPIDKNEAHAEIRRLPRDNMDLLELLAAEAFTEVALNRDIPQL